MAIAGAQEIVTNVQKELTHAEYPNSDHEHDYTMTDIKKAFKEDFCDEMDDSNKYCDMAHAAEMEGHEDLAKGLYLMSYDEYTHAKFIHDNLVDWGYEFPEKESMKWHELKERIHRKFRK